MKILATATYINLIRDATAFAKNWLGLSNAAAGRSALGLGTAATQDSTAFEPAGSVSAHSSDTTDVHGIADTSLLLDTGDIGGTVQGYSANLAAIAALSPAADRGVYYTSATAASLFTLTSQARTLLSQTTADKQRTSMGALGGKFSVTTSDQVVNNSAALGNALPSVSLTTNKTYGFLFYLPYTSNSSGGVKFSLTGGGTVALLNWHAIIVSTGAGIVNDNKGTAFATPTAGYTATTSGTCFIFGVVNLSSSGGIRTAFAQQTAHASDSKILTGACGVAVQLD